MKTGQVGIIHHIEIYVKDLEKTKKFWEWLLGKLGYSEYQVWEGGVSFILGETYIVFVQAEEKFLDIPYHRCRAGLNHIAFHGKSRDFVDKVTWELKEKGVKILYEDSHPYAGGDQYYAVYFEDPDRMKIEITAD